MKPFKIVNLLIFGSLWFSGCMQFNNNSREQINCNANSNQKMTKQMDTSTIAIIPFETSFHWIFENCENFKPTSLSTDDLSTIEEILKECLAMYNAAMEKQFEDCKNKRPELVLEKKDFVIGIENYKRQYIPVINGCGEKEVWVNCFCDYFEKDFDWKTKIVSVEDGGNCYFNLKINLSTGKYYDFMVNGRS
jgi:hypothetical protein